MEGTSTIKPSMPQDKENESYKHWLFVSDDDKGDMQLLGESIIQGTAHAISDGSYFEHANVGAAAWVLTDSSYKVVSEGTSIAPGEGDIHSSFWSELTGILAILQKLENICIDQHIQSGTITLHCDNKSALKVIAYWQLQKVNPQRQNADLISACIKLRDSLPISIVCRHMKAHQDSTIRVQDLEPAAQWNVCVDKQAKLLAELVIKGHYNHIVESSHPLSFPHCSFNGTHILHNMADRIYEEISKSKMIQYWLEKERLTPTSKELIDIDSMTKAHSAMSFTQKKFTAKWACKFVATGKNMQRWKQ